MKAKKYIIAGFFVLLLFASTVLVVFWRNNMRLKEFSPEFSELIESGNLSQLSLTIYYVEPTMVTRLPVSIDNLISGKYGSQKIVIDSNDLEKHIDLLVELNNTALKRLIKKPYLNARLYYVFETEKNKIFEVAFWGENYNVVVNGIEVKENTVLYDVIIPFLSENKVKNWESHLSKRR
jgi:hypothetical protein